MTPTRHPPAQTARLRLLMLAALGIGAMVVWLGWKVSRPTPTVPELAREGATVPMSANVAVADGAGGRGASKAGAEAEWRPAPARSGVDASNIYKNAFVLFDQLSEEAKKMIRQPREEVEAEKAAELFEKLAGILALLHEAAGADYCDWGQGPVSFDMPMPQIQKANDLGKAALWAAAYQFSTDPAAALATLADRAQLGHHLGETLIGVLVGSAFESAANELLQQHAAALDPTLAGRVQELVRGSKVDADVARAFAAEESMIADLAARYAKSPEQLAALVTAGGRAQDAAALASFAGQGERLAAEFEFIRNLQRQAAAAMLMPQRDFLEWQKAVDAQLNSGDHPLAKLLVPSLTRVQTRLQQTRVERTLLDAGLAVMNGGPAALAGYRDPSTGGSLTYVPAPAGFALRSTFEVKGKPVTMTFPTPTGR